MRINIVMGFFLPVPAVAGGAMEKAWSRLARDFARAGHEVTLLSRRWPGFPDREQRDGVEMIRVPGFDHRRRLAANLLLDGLWGLRVRRRLPAADITVCNTISLPIHLPRFRPAAGRVVAVLARMPRGQLRFYRRIARLVAISQAVADRVARECPALRDRTRVVPLPIDWELHARAAGRTGDPVTIGYIGRLHPEKGIELLLRAAARLVGDSALPAWRVVVRGPSDVRHGGGGPAYVQKLRAEFGPRLGDRLAFEPPVFDERELARCYGALDLFCYPSLADRGEALGVAPLEAMASGAVPVLSGLECFLEMLRDGINGFAFDHTAAAPDGELARLLAWLIREPGIRATIAEQAQADSRRFDYAAVARALLDDFAQLTAQPPRR